MNEKLPRLVSIGSISAASLLIEGFRNQQLHITAIVPTTDTGSSTGVIRDWFFMPAPGDVRAVLTTLGDETDDRSRLLKQLFEYRLRATRFPEMHNMAVGNLVLAALTEMTGSFSKAVKEAGALLNINGMVIPVTSQYAHIKAVLEDGQEVLGEKQVRRLGKSRIRELGLDRDNVPLGDGVAEAIGEADLILIGPGCLFTSVAACLVVPGLADQVSRARGATVYCCNTTTTPGQTDGFTIPDHVEVVTRCLSNVPPDYVLINNRRPGTEIEAAYEQDGIQVLIPSADEVTTIAQRGCTPQLADLIEEGWAGKRTLHKLDSIRHDPRKIEAVLMSIFRERRREETYSSQ